ncbi:MAG: hypothetical protein IPN69_08670, partial [Acidobacteria bacterium]|nr:hypothetical protein [Acidobacteriota bacterium]
LRFQISDYFTFGGLLVEDILSDGQEFQIKSATFRVTDKNGTTSGSFEEGVNLEAKKSHKVKCKKVNGGANRFTAFEGDRRKRRRQAVSRFRIIVGGNNGTSEYPGRR